MAIFGAQGIRDAMSKSYHKHVADLRGKPLPDGTSLHQAALYGALATRYMVGFNSMPEVAVWAELAPFLRLPGNDGLAALAEYVVYKEMSAKANVEMLSDQIRSGWSLLSQEERETFRIAAQANRVAWLALI